MPDTPEAQPARGFGRMLQTLLTTPAPSTAVAIAAGHVAVVQMAQGGGAPAIAGYARVALPEGSVTPSVTMPNIQDPAAVAQAVGEALEQLPRRPSRVALVVPDGAAKVSLVQFDEPPTRAADTDELIRWQVRKGAPFSLEEAQVAWMPGVRRADGGQAFAVVLARRAVVAEYEAACEAASAHAGVVDLAGFNLINAALAHGVGHEGGDWLLVHAAGGAGSIAIVRDGRLLFFRHMPADGGRLDDLVHQTAMYYQDRLEGGGILRAVVVGDDGAAREVVGRLAGVPVERLADRMVNLLADRGAGGTARLDMLAAPIGLLLRDRAAAARAA